MSCYEWAHGEIKLPSGTMPILRAHLTAVADRIIGDLVDETTRAWDRLKKVSPAKRQSLLWDMELSEDTCHLLCQYKANPKTGKWETKYAKPSLAVIKKHVMGREDVYGKGKCLVLRCGYEATITLHGNTVIWDVPENNHARERADAHPLAVALFDFLESRVEWTARSGGKIVGNDEYHRDSYEAGGGGNYVIREYSKKAVAERRQARYGRLGRYAYASAGFGGRRVW